jgi:immune inhibitor A
MIIGFLTSMQDNSVNVNDFSDDPEMQSLDTEQSKLYDLLSNGYIPYHPDPTPYTITQPDGTTFEAKKVGERIGGHVETLEGFTVMEGNGGWWTYADKNENGFLIPSEHIVGKTDFHNIMNLPMHLSNDYPEVEERSHGFEGGTRAPPTNTTWRAVAIMLEFTDETFDTVTKADFEQMLNGTSGQTMRTYYQEVSYGQFDIEIDVVGPFTSAYTMAYYGADVGPADSNPATRDDGNVSITEMAKEAVQLADPTVDFSPYDVDDDGTIDAIFVIHAGPGQEGSGPSYAIWSHMSFINYMTNDGVRASRYSTEPENGKVGVFVHEFGHILGLPDLYDTDYSSDGIGRWGVMAGGSWNGGGNSPAHFCAWAKIELGWLEPTIVTSDLSLFQIEIPPVWNNSVVYKIWAFDPAVNSYEYFLVENRQKDGYDSFLPGEGILVWHIDELVPGNQDETHYKVDLEEADGDQELEAGSGSQATDAWVNDLTGFRNTTNPNSTSYNGTETGVWVWNISDIHADGNMSIGFNEWYSGPEGIYISDPVTNASILPVYDFIIKDSDFPDEDIGIDNDGNNGSYILEWRLNGTPNPWTDTPAQTMISWDGTTGVINCTMLVEGFWDFRVRIHDEEGHLFYTPEVYNIAIPTKIPPVAYAGPDNTTDVLYDTVLDGSGSTDNSGFIAWFNWSFGDGTYLNGTNSIVTHNWSDPGVYTVILNVSDSFGNWDTDIVNITVVDMGAPVTTLIIGNPKYTEHQAISWNITSDTVIALVSVDNYVGVNFTWYTIDGEYFVYTGTFTFTGYSEGPHDFTWGAEDNVGNNETGNAIFIVVDDTAPTTSISISDPKYRTIPTDILNVTNTAVFTISAWDQYAGIDYTWHSIESDFYFGAVFTLDGYSDGIYTIFYSSVDHVGNYLDKNITVKLDSTPPTSNIVHGDPKYRAQVGDRWNITVVTELSITGASDGDGVGLNYTWYTIDGSFYLYSGNFILSPGLHTISWGGIDLLGCNETGNSVEVFVDDAPPVTSLDISEPKFGVSPTYVDSTTQFTLIADDGLGSGSQSTYYKIDSGSWILYSGFFTIASSGPHTIYFNSTDNLGFLESTKSYDILVDNQPPVTTIHLGTPNYGSSPTFVDSTTIFTFSATDGSESGVESTWYKIDSGSWTLYTGGFTVSSPGAHTIYFNSTDYVDHTEITKSLDIFVDNMAPSVSISVGEPKIGSSPTRVGISTPFNLTADDGNGSGVESIWYNIDATGWVLYTNNFTVTIPGDHDIYFYAADNLGHNALNDQIDIFVDTTAPTTTITVMDPKFGSTPTYVTSSTQFNLSATDGPGCGVESTWYKIDSGSWIEYLSNFTVPATGPHTISFYSSDILGQVEITQNYDIVVDDSEPVTTISSSEPKHGSSPTFVNESTIFTLSPSDGSGSGVSTTKYKIDTSVWLTYSGSFQVFGDGPHTLTFYSTDNLGHRESNQTFEIYTDTQKPITSIAVGDQKYGSSPTYINSFTPVTLTSSDGTGSGVDSIWYRIDSGNWNLYTGDFTVSTPGAHTIVYNATDNLGQHEQMKGSSIFVDNSPPTTDHFIGDPQYGSSPLNVNLVTPISLSFDDGTGSGVASTWYKIDSGGSWTLYTGDFSLSSGGIHTIFYYSTDNLNQDEPERSVDIFCDIYPPTTNLTVNIPRFRAIDLHIWNVTDQTLFELESMDGDLDFIWYTIDSEIYLGTAFRFGDFVSEDGVHTITWGGLDVLDNNETGNSMMIYLDKTTPTTSIKVGNPKYRQSVSDEWRVTKDTDFYLEVEDDSDLSVTWFTINGDYFEGTNFDLSGYSDGPITITWGSIDNLDHNETGNSLNVILDSNLKFIDLVLGDPKYRAEDTDLFNITMDTPFTLTAFDKYLDVDFTWYTIDGDYFTGTSFTLTGYPEGLRTVAFGTMDEFGTSETWETILVYLDNSPPVTTLGVGEPKFQSSEDDPWKITWESTFTLSSYDMFSGIAEIWHSINGVKYYGTTFDLDERNDGLYEIAWGASDNLDFQETGNEIEVILDNDPPIIEIYVGEPNSTIDDVIHITSDTKITLISLDSDPTIIYYSIDGGSKFSTYTSPFTVPGSTTEILFYGVDSLGNPGEVKGLEVFVNNNDYDDDGLVDLIDPDDDNDGLWDIQEDLDQDGVLDKGETDPLNADTDSDGYLDYEDKYPQDASKYRDPTDWEKIPVLGGYEQGLCMTLIIIGIILLIVLLYLFRRYRMYRAKSSWKEESEINGSENNK